MNATRGEVVKGNIVKFPTIISLYGLDRKVKLSLNIVVKGGEDGVDTTRRVCG